jgi:hypothetical protein
LALRRRELQAQEQEEQLTQMKEDSERSVPPALLGRWRTRRTRSPLGTTVLQKTAASWLTQGNMQWFRAQPEDLLPCKPKPVTVLRLPTNSGWPQAQIHSTMEAAQALPAHQK